ncbi:BgTH12-03464 [Blumeria graminis f. sp. triticale]|nr:BgTH12-03464 [Blumeria graminis f. sp. triticale]
MDSPATKLPRFDIDSYVSNYQGRTRFERLFHIGTNSTILRVEALKAAIHEAKNGKDIKRYLDACIELEKVGPNEPEAMKDEMWIERVKSTNQIETQSLEAELKQYKNNLIKESIRMGNEDLGKHYLAIGELGKAYDAFGRMRQDSVAPKHIIEVCQHLIDISVEQRNWLAVISCVQKLKQVMTLKKEERPFQPYLCAAEGLASIDSGKYQQAANIFLLSEPGLGPNFNTIISPNDIAVYGGLCALATFGRKELRTRVLDNSNFRTYLELEPHIRRAVNFFVNSRYDSCLEILESYHTDFYLDIYLQKHVDELYKLVRRKCIVQYFIPFSCVTIDSLNVAFAAPGTDIEKELVTMIEGQDLDARIDTQNRLLISVPSTPRHALQNYTLESARRFEDEARLRIQHMNIYDAGLEINGAQSGLDGLDEIPEPRIRRDKQSSGYHRAFKAMAEN